MSTRTLVVRLLRQRFIVAVYCILRVRALVSTICVQMELRITFCRCGMELTTAKRSTCTMDFAINTITFLLLRFCWMPSHRFSTAQWTRYKLFNSNLLFYMANEPSPIVCNTCGSWRELWGSESGYVNAMADFFFSLGLLSKRRRVKIMR